MIISNWIQGAAPMQKHVLIRLNKYQGYEASMMSAELAPTPLI